MGAIEMRRFEIINGFFSIKNAIIPQIYTAKPLMVLSQLLHKDKINKKILTFLKKGLPRV
jgi:hypothetical protein